MPDVLFRFLKCYGINLRQFRRALRNTRRFVQDYKRYRSLHERASPKIKGSFTPDTHLLFPCLLEFDDTAGPLGTYFHQDLWAARRVFSRRPERHLDIGSRVDGFIAHLLVFMEVSVVDIRELTSKVPGLNFIKANATTMELFETNSIDSISCLHAAEHFGLGRYGDPVDPEACFVFMRSLQRALKVGGRLYFSVPIGPERLFFNAHRVFSSMTILETFDGLKLVSFSAVTADDALAEDVRPEDYLKKGFKVGLFEFTKLAP